ncbi:MAG: hypothetical protein KDB14_07285, partial [Planctomycetales bacterium]|nr:hypothetical protein [Planctomycetales bacterium]
MDSAIAQDPTPAPITVAVADITTAKVDGSWVVASETRKVSTVISIAGEASKAKYVFVILSGGAVAIELPTEDGRLFGVSGPAGKYTADILAFEPGKFQERIEFTIGKPSPDDDDD